MTRDCYTCSHSSAWGGPGSIARCYALTLDEVEDRGVVDFCEASGVNDEDGDIRGWPRKGNTVACPKWRAREVSDG